jgi:hypothetical protein
MIPAAAFALPLGLARLVNVTAVDGGCVDGPNGGTVEAWDIQPGFTYTITIADVTDCANGGTDPTLNVRVNSSIPGYEYTDLIAYYVSPGVYEFDYSLPASAWCTLPIFYCTVPDEWLTTGKFVRASDGDNFQAHLRASTFGDGCTNPIMILGPECGMLGTEDSSWGTIKGIYR